MLTHFNIQQSLANQHQTDRYRQLVSVRTGVTPMIDIAGKHYLNFASNDYLGLATNPELCQEFANISQQIQQIGSGASHLITGHHQYHDDLAKTLAKITGYEKALTFSTGYMANVGIIQALANKDTVIFSDKLNHASIVDGTILSRAKVIRFAHRDYQQLENQLQNTTAKQKLIITDHVFSMDGTLADLEKLDELCQRYECALMIDDAHGFGLPYQAYYGQLPKADIYMATFGKAIGTAGAFVAGSEQLIDYLVNFARPYIYTTAMPPVLAKITEKSIEISQYHTEKSQQLLANIQQLSHGLTTQGWQVGIDNQPCQTAIIPVLIGDNDKTVQLANHLKENGCWVSAIRPPTVPVGTARLRFCVSANHSAEHIEQLLNIMYQLRQ